jgi:predicted oxidoreductase
MYLTFEQAMQIIKPNGAKNPNYAGTRIRQLINFGYLTEAKPDEIFVKHFEDFVSLGNIKTECLVTAESVYKYIQDRNAVKEQLGKIPKQNRHVKAVYANDTIMNFMSVELACLYFGISRVRIMNSIEKKKYIRVPEIDELVKFI